MSNLDDLRARKAERDAKRQSEREAREFETLSLEEKLEAELGGPSGKAFQIVDVTDEPLVVVKPGPAVLFKRFRDSKMGLDDIQLFVASCVHQPDKATFSGIVERRAGALVRVFDALVALYRGEEAADGKKY